MMNHLFVARTLWRTSLVAAAVASQACRDAVESPRGAAEGLLNLSASNTRDVQPRSIRPEEMQFAEIGRVAPSAAGYFLNEAGDIVLLVRDSTDIGAATAQAQALVSSGTIKSSRKRNPTIQIQAAKFSFGQLATWRDALGDRIWAVRGVTSLDLDERNNRIAIGVDPAYLSAATLDARNFSATIGVDTTSLAFRIHAPLTFSATSAAARSTRGFFVGSSITQQADTLVGGVILRTSSSVALNGGPGDCSLGFIADRNGTRALVTSTHCTSVWGGGPDGTTMSQWPNRQVGTESLDPNKAKCGAFNWCRNSEASLFNQTGAFPLTGG